MNGSQNFVVTAPALSTYSGRSGYYLITKAMKDFAAKKYSKVEAKMLQTLHDEGTTRDMMATELMGAPDNIFQRELLPGYFKASRFMFSLMEEFNRGSTALAFFQEARRKGENVIAAVEIARNAVWDAHFPVGKADRPVLARGVVAPAFIFQTYNINYVQWVKNGIREGKYAQVAKSFGAIFVYGGVISLPFSKVICDAIMYGWGKDCEEEIRKGMDYMAKAFLGDEYHETVKRAKDLVTRGAPAALFGFDLSGGMDPTGFIPEKLTDLVGVAAQVPVKLQQAHRQFKAGNTWRGIEDLTPEFVNNPLAAIRTMMYGEYERSGGPIFDSEGRQYYPSYPDAIKLFFGVQPLERTKRYKVADIQRRKEMRQTRLRRAAMDAAMVAKQRMNTAKKKGNEEGYIEHKETLKQILSDVNDFTKYDDYPVQIFYSDILENFIASRKTGAQGRYDKELHKVFDIK